MADIYVTTAGNDSTGNGTSGNPYATPGKAAGVAASGDRICLKSGTYTLTGSTYNVAGGPVALPANVSLQGYGTTPGDGGTPPVIHAGSITGLTSGIIDTYNGGYNGTANWINNITVNGNNGTNNYGINIRQYAHTVWGCRALNCYYGFKIDNQSDGPILCVADACTVGFYANGQMNAASYCVAKNCTVIGFQINTCHSCIAYACQDGFIPQSYPATWDKCVAYGCANNGFHLNTYDIGSVMNCLSIKNGGYGFRVTNSNTGFFYNVGGTSTAANTSGNTFGTINNNIGFSTVNADPFVDAANGDFDVNNTAGSGAALRALTFDLLW